MAIDFSWNNNNILDYCFNAYILRIEFAFRDNLQLVRAVTTLIQQGLRIHSVYLLIFLPITLNKDFCLVKFLDFCN